MINEKLKKLTEKKYEKKFCFHKWVKFNLGGMRTHRVCLKCFKKQSKLFTNLPTFWIDMN